MRPYEDFFPFVSPFCRNASDIAMTVELRRAAVEFCRDSKVWRDWLQQHSIQADEPMVTLVPPEGGQVIEIRSVWFDGSEIDPVTDDGLRAYGLTIDDTGTAPTLFGIEQDDDEIKALRLYPISTTAYSNKLRIRAVIEPTDDSVGVPNFLYDRYRQGIANLALSKLWTLDEPWANAERAMFFAQQANVDKGKAKSDAARADTTPAITTTGAVLLMATILYVQNDQMPPLRVWLHQGRTPEGAEPIDVSGSGVTVRAHVKFDGVFKESIVGTKSTGLYRGEDKKTGIWDVTTAAPYDVAGVGGIVLFYPSTTTFDEEGDYLVEYEIEWADGKPQTVYKTDTVSVRSEFA